MKLFAKCVLIGFGLNIAAIPFKTLGVETHYVIALSFPLFFIFPYLAFRRYGIPGTNGSVIALGLVTGLVLSCFEPIIISLATGKFQIYFLLRLAVRIMAVFCAFALWRLKGVMSSVPAIVGSLVTLFVVFKGDAMWTHYTIYGNFTGRVAPARIANYQVDGVDQYGARITNETFDSKVVLLDFWNTRCGWCFEGFPSLQAFYQKRKEHPTVAIYAVDKPLEEDAVGEAFKMIADEGYDFPVLLPSDPELPERFGVSVYPTTLVLDVAGNVIYRGELKGAITLVESMIQ